MFEAVLHAKVLFFDNNPVGMNNFTFLEKTNGYFIFLGRIVNRFSKDVGFLDDLLPYSFCEFLLVSLFLLIPICGVSTYFENAI